MLTRFRIQWRWGEGGGGSKLRLCGRNKYRLEVVELSPVVGCHHWGTRATSPRERKAATGRVAGRRKQYAAAAAAAATIRRPGNRTSEIDGGYRSDHGVWPDLRAARHPTGRQPAPRGAAAVSAAAAAAAARTGKRIPAGCRPRDHIQPPTSPPPPRPLSPQEYRCTVHDAKFHPLISPSARARYSYRISSPPSSGLPNSTLPGPTSDSIHQHDNLLSPNFTPG